MAPHSLDVLLRHRPRSIAARGLYRWIKVGPDTSAGANLMPLLRTRRVMRVASPRHAWPGIPGGPPFLTFCPGDCTWKSIGPSAGFMSFSPEKAQIELAWATAPVGVFPEPENGTPAVPGGPLTSPATAALALAPARAAVQTATASNGFLIIVYPFTADALIGVSRKLLRGGGSEAVRADPEDRRLGGSAGLREPIGVTDE